jgi:hypothetical protein
MIKFKQFIDKKERDAKHQLKIIEHILQKNGFKVNDHLSDDDPYVFVHNPKKDTFFGGIRIYKVGDHIAFRVQREEKTEPFGSAYGMEIEDMFTDLLTDHHKPEEAGKKVMEAVVNEVKRFFEKSAQAEKELRDKEFDQNPFGKVVIRSSDFGIDYSNMVSNYKG